MTDKEKARLEFARTHKHRKAIVKRTLRPDYTYDTSIEGVGGDGFGYARDEYGKLVKIAHAGGVHIDLDVEIGLNVCIDRATREGEFTVIGEGTKIDNLVHIAHNCKIGKHNLIVAGAVIGGSVEIGDFCFIGMGALIKNKVKIGNNVTIGMGSVVLKDVPDNSVVYGNPARTKEEHEKLKNL